MVTRPYDTRGKQEKRMSDNKQYTGHDHRIVCSRLAWQRSNTNIRQTPGEGVDHCCMLHYTSYCNSHNAGQTTHSQAAIANPLSFGFPSHLTFLCPPFFQCSVWCSRPQYRAVRHFEHALFASCPHTQQTFTPQAAGSAPACRFAKTEASSYHAQVETYGRYLRTGSKALQSASNVRI